jgi:Uncharacterized protein conserved in cyanobacteria
VQQTRRQYTLDDYFSMQRGIDLKLEYFNGEIFAISGGTVGHNRISKNVLKFLDAAVGSSCEAFGSDMRMSTPSGLYTYPDAFVVCGSKVSNSLETISNNTVVIVEVLSEATRNYDRGEKFEHYCSIPTLGHYLLIEQSLMRVEHRRLDTDGSWSHEIVESPDQIVHLSAVGVDFPLARIYEGIDFSSRSVSSVE